MQEVSPDDILKMISTIYRKTQMYLNEETKALGVTSGQTPFLMIICENGKMVQNQFCEILDMDKSTVAKMMAKLEAKGYITRTSNPRDNRAIDVYPTQKAQELYPMLKSIGEGWSVKMTENLTEIERSIFFEMMRKVTENVEIGRAHV